MLIGYFFIVWHTIQLKHFPYSIVSSVLLAEMTYLRVGLLYLMWAPNYHWFFIAANFSIAAMNI